MSGAVPYLDENYRITFPDTTDEYGIAAVGGNLSPGVLLSAYEQGLFPWFNEGEPILWWSPDQRAVLLPGDIHISRSMRRFLKHTRMTVTFDQAFPQVITACRTISRPGQEGTWITGDMEVAYNRMHDLGYAHSVEVWDPLFSSELPAGGLYGLQLGRVFFGESMFTHVPNGSKLALYYLYNRMLEADMVMIDCQVMNDHLATLGVREVPRPEYLRLLQKALQDYR